MRGLEIGGQILWRDGKSFLDLLETGVSHGHSKHDVVFKCFVHPVERFYFEGMGKDWDRVSNPLTMAETVEAITMETSPHASHATSLVSLVFCTAFKSSSVYLLSLRESL